jgi:hypothetical protein
MDKLRVAAKVVLGKAPALEDEPRPDQLVGEVKAHQGYDR